MRLKKFFKSRTVRVITATVFILCTFFVTVLPSFAISPPSTLPSYTPVPPTFTFNTLSVTGLPLGDLAASYVFEVFWLQNYFGGFNRLRPLFIYSSWPSPWGTQLNAQTYLVCSSDPGAYSILTSDGFVKTLFDSSLSHPTLYYFKLTGQGFKFSYSQELSIYLLETPEDVVLWYANTPGGFLPTERDYWVHNTGFATGIPLNESGDLSALVNAYENYWEFYNKTGSQSAETRYQEGLDLGKAQGYEIGKSEGYDLGYDVGYDVGYDTGYAGGYDQGYINGDLEGYDSGYRKGYTDGRLDSTYELDIGSIFDSFMQGTYNFIHTAFGFELFGVNISGLLMLIVGVVIIVFVVRFIWGFVA